MLKPKSVPFIFFVCSLITVFGHAQANEIDPGTLPPPQIAVSPANLNLNLDEGGDSGAVRVFNLGKNVIKVRSRVNHFDLDDENKVRVIAPTPQSLDQWLVINPLEFEIPAGGQQVVRFAVRPNVKPLAGEHRAMVFFEQVPDENLSDSKVQVTFRLGVALYALAGNIVRRAELRSVDVDQLDNKIRIKFDVLSDGNANVRLAGQFSVWPKTEFPGATRLRRYNLTETHGDVPDEVDSVGKLPNTPVLPGERRTIVANITTPKVPGDYIVGVIGEIEGDTFVRVLPLTISR